MSALCELDHLLIDRDPSIPALRTVLEGASLTRALREEGVILNGPDDWELAYLRYKPGTYCIAAYRRPGNSELIGYAKAFAPGTRAKLWKQSRRHGQGAGSWRFERRLLSCAVFPHDDKLPALRRLDIAEPKHRFLRKLFRKRYTDLWDAPTAQLAYKPERRYVARVGEGDHGAVVKLYTKRAFSRLFIPSDQLEARAPLDLAPVLGILARRQAVAFGWVPGRRLDLSFIGADPDLAQARLAGAALARLHEQTVSGLPTRMPGVGHDQLLAIAREVSCTYPALALDTNRLVARLLERRSEIRGRCGFTHGDFYPKQVLTKADTATILDLDGAHIGQQSTDIGLFIAHVERNALRGLIRPDRVDDLRAAFLDGYGDLGEDLDPREIAIRTCEGLLSLLPAPYRRREPDWPGRTKQILARASTILHSTTPRRATVYAATDLLR